MTAPADGSFSLEPSPARRGKLGYAHPLAHYEAVYGTKVRQIKNWLDRGRPEGGKEDLPPLDSPKDMPTWWVRNYPNRSVPAKIHHAARRAEQEAFSSGAAVPEKNPTNQTSKPDTATPGPVNTGATPAALRDAVDFTQVAPMDMAGAVDDQRRVLAILQRDYKQALSDPNADDATITMRANRVDKCLERLRKIEGSLEEWRKSRGELIAIGDVHADWSNLLVALRNIRERMPDDVASNLPNPGLPVDVFAKIQDSLRAALRAQVDREDALLRSARHWVAPSQPVLAA